MRLEYPISVGNVRRFSSSGSIGIRQRGLGRAEAAGNRARAELIRVLRCQAAQRRRQRRILVGRRQRIGQQVHLRRRHVFERARRRRPRPAVDRPCAAAPARRSVPARPSPAPAAPCSSPHRPAAIRRRPCACPPSEAAAEDTFHQRGITAVTIICGTRSPQISACSLLGTRKFCSAFGERVGQGSKRAHQPSARALPASPSRTPRFPSTASAGSRSR